MFQKSNKTTFHVNMKEFSIPHFERSMRQFARTHILLFFQFMLLLFIRYNLLNQMLCCILVCFVSNESLRFWFLLKLVNIWSTVYIEYYVYVNDGVCEPDKIEIQSFIDLLFDISSIELIFFNNDQSMKLEHVFSLRN